MIKDDLISHFLPPQQEEARVGSKNRPWPHGRTPEEHRALNRAQWAALDKAAVRRTRRHEFVRRLMASFKGVINRLKGARKAQA